MEVRNRLPLFFPLLAALLAAGGCASTGAPDHWLPTAAEGPTDPYGAWMIVEFVKSHEDEFLVGEFLGIDGDSLYVLTNFGPAHDPVRAVPLGIVKKAQIAHFDPQAENATGWVAAGSVSTLSHGLGAGLTFPLWIIFGSAMAGAHSRTPLENYPEITWGELQMYARFPQGPPPGLHQLGLRPKNPSAPPPPVEPSDQEFPY